MNKIVKNTVIFSLISMMQVGVGIGVVEATPIVNELAFRQQDGRYGLDRDRDRHERRRSENQRHEREMRRHSHESERAWHERQRWENERHDENLRRIAHDILELIFDS